MTRFWRRWALLLLVLAAALPGQTGAALAHAALIGTEPADGAVVATAPAVLRITFNEPTAPLALALVTPEGERIALDRYRLDDATLAITAPDDLGEGTYVLTWRVVSEDGHPVGGSAVFSIGRPTPGGGAVAAAPEDRALQLAIWLTRVLLYAGLFLGAGGAFFIRWLGEGAPASRRIVAVLAVLGAVAAALSVGLQGLDALAVPLADLAQPVVWATGWATRYGTTAALAAAALALAVAALGVPGIAGRLAALAALGGVGLALAASGHAASADPRWLTRPAVFLHAVGITFWAGSLIPLAAALRQGGAPAGRILGRFSRAAPIAVLPLVASGILLAVVQLGHLSALWSTAYGRVLVVKLLAVAALLALAVVNRLRLTEPARAGDAAAARLLRRSIAAELVLVAAVLGLAACWRFTPPPRALAAAAAAPAEIHIHTLPAMADVTITPGRVGTADVAIVVMTGEFAPLDPKEITLVLSEPAAGIEPIRRQARRAGDGSWRVDGLVLPLPGLWKLRLDVLVSDFDLVKLEGEVRINP